MTDQTPSDIDERVRDLELRHQERARDYLVKASAFSILAEFSVQPLAGHEGRMTYRRRDLVLTDTLDGWIVEYDGVTMGRVMPDAVIDILALLRAVDDLADLLDDADRARRS